MEPLRILLVDDEPHILSALHRHLRQAFRGAVPAVRIEVESDPQRALARLQERAYAVVVSDFRMPGMNGVELLAAYRHLQPLGTRVLLSGQVDRDGLMAAINTAHVARFVAKPWDDAELYRIVNEGLAAYRQGLAQADVLDTVACIQGELSPQEQERRRLERLDPGITHVERDETGAVLMGSL